MKTGTKWGLSATIKAPVDEILNFAAYHLELGAHRLYIYLDNDNPDAFAALKAHPKIRVMVCDDTYWRNRTGKRPEKHQSRQTINASHAYDRRVEVDWLIHMDVDEFLWPDSDLLDELDLVDPTVICARARPQEALAGDGMAYKGFIAEDRDRRSIVNRLYPRFGEFIKGGFLSHLAGKVFVRTGVAKVTVRIHNAFQDNDQGTRFKAQEVELPGLALCHNHAKSWESWVATYHFRLEQGSYRAGLALNRPLYQGGISMHDLFKWIEYENGPQGLRAFFDEVCADSPELRDRLAREGLLCICDLQLDAKRAKHFPL